MPGDIKVPGIGDIPKKYAVGAVVVAVGLGVVVYLRARNAANTTAAADNAAASTPSTSSTDTGIDPSTGVPYADEGGYSTSIDPSTGVPYADEYGAGGGYGYGGYGGNSGYDAAGYPIGSAADIQWQANQNSGVTTNEEWLQQAASGAVPGNSNAIEAACARVLGGLTVTTAQKDLFLEAIGILGNPPQGYPKPIKTSDTSGQPGGGKSGKVKVPNVVGKSQEEAFRMLAAAGLHASGQTAEPGKVLTVTKQDPAAGKTVDRGSTVQLTSAVRPKIQVHDWVTSGKVKY